MTSPLLPFTADVPPTIRLTSVLNMSLYRVLGEDDIAIKEFCQSRLGTHHGMLFIDYVNCPLKKPCPLVWSLEIGHSPEEQSYLDGPKLSQMVVEKLAAMLSEQSIDDVVIPVFKVFQSDVLVSLTRPLIIGELPVGTPAKVVPTSPLAYPEGCNEITFEDGTIIQISHPIRSISKDEADGFFGVSYKLSEHAQGQLVDVNFICLQEGTGVEPAAMYAALSTYAKENYLPAARVEYLQMGTSELHTFIPEERIFPAQQPAVILPSDPSEEASA